MPRGVARFPIFFLIALFVGCGEPSDGGPRPGPERSDSEIRESVQQVNEDQEFPVLWLGRRYRGYNFNEISEGSPAYAVGVYYGTYEIPSDQREGGCPLPYQLQQRDACRKFPVAGNRELRRARDGTITYPEGGGQVVITGRTYVKVFGKNARAAIRNLRPLGQEEPPKRLQPAAKCVAGSGR